MRDWNARSAVWAAIAAAVLLAGVGSGALVSHLLTGHSPSTDAGQALTSGRGPVSRPTADSWWKPLPAAVGPIVPASIVIEKFHIRAPVEQKGIDSQNTMQSPDRPTDVAWYTFTAQPGAGSNAVFAGHRDFAGVGNPAVFWNLDKLMNGDLIDVVSDHQTEIRYRVTMTWNYSLSTIPMADVLASDPSDEITLITSAGNFVRGGYDHRFVVRALRTAIQGP
jgi:hypothetical protein